MTEKTSTRLRHLNNRLYTWCLHLHDKHSHCFLYRKIASILSSRVAQIILRKLTLGGCRLDVSMSSVELSRRPSRPVAEIRRVTRNDGPNLYIFTAHMGSSLLEEMIEALFNYRRANMDIKIVHKAYCDPSRLQSISKSSKRVSVSHLYPERYNLVMLEEHCVNKFVVHVTDPRLQLVRDTESIVKRGRINQDMQEAIRSAKFRHPVPENYIDLSLSDRVELVCRSGHFSEMVSFAKDWMEVKKNPLSEWNFDILIVRWEDLVMDRDAYFDRLALFWGFEKIDWENAILSERYDIRNTSSLDWIEGLSPSLIEYINSFISDEILEFYGWKR